MGTTTPVLAWVVTSGVRCGAVLMDDVRDQIIVRLNIAAREAQKWDLLHAYAHTRPAFFFVFLVFF